MSSFAEADTEAGFYDGDSYSFYDGDSTIVLNKYRSSRFAFPCIRRDKSPPRSPPIWVWSSPSSLGSPWSPQGDIVPEPEPWAVNMAKEIETAKAEAATRFEKKADSKSVSKAKGTTKTKSKQSKENKGKKNKGKETKEKKD